MRLICESCDMGYDPLATICPWCGASSQVAHTTHDVSVCDTELVIDYWLCKFDTGEVYQMFDGHPLDIQGLRRTLSRYTVITFNGINYDFPIIALALAGATNTQLKQANDAIICPAPLQGAKSWEILADTTVALILADAPARVIVAHIEMLRRSRAPGKFKSTVTPNQFDHIDMIEVLPGQGSLKMYMAKQHSRKLQDLPFDPDARFNWLDRAQCRWYCDNDLHGTRELYDAFQAQLNLRKDMSAEYGIDLRSKSDAQMAEAVMKSLLPFKVQVPVIPAGTQFYYRPPEWLKLTTSNLIERIAASPFFITYEGGIAPSYDNHLVDWGTSRCDSTHTANG